MTDTANKAPPKRSSDQLEIAASASELHDVEMEDAHGKPAAPYPSRKRKKEDAQQAAEQQYDALDGGDSASTESSQSEKQDRKRRKREEPPRSVPVRSPVVPQLSQQPRTAIPLENANTMNGEFYKPKSPTNDVKRSPAVPRVTLAPEASVYQQPLLSPAPQRASPMSASKFSIYSTKYFSGEDYNGASPGAVSQYPVTHSRSRPASPSYAPTRPATTNSLHLVNGTSIDSTSIDSTSTQEIYDSSKSDSQPVAPTNSFLLVCFGAIFGVILASLAISAGIVPQVWLVSPQQPRHTDDSAIQTLKQELLSKIEEAKLYTNSAQKQWSEESYYVKNLLDEIQKRQAEIGAHAKVSSSPADSKDSQLVVLQKAKEFVDDAMNSLVQEKIGTVMELVNRLQKQMEEDRTKSTEVAESSNRIAISERAELYTFMEKLINERLAGDLVGRPDFALRTMGAEVIKHSPSYMWSSTGYGESALYSLFKRFFTTKMNPASTILDPNLSLGNCWAFYGSRGFALVRLANSVAVDAFSVDHVPPSVSPDVLSAPRRIRVHGFRYDYISEAEYAADNLNILLKERMRRSWSKQSLPETSQADEELDAKIIHKYGGIQCSEFSYVVGKGAVQTFDVPAASDCRNKRLLSLFLVDVLDNHGNNDYTCMYRFRIHGKRESTS